MQQVRQQNLCQVSERTMRRTSLVNLVSGGLLLCVFGAPLAYVGSHLLAPAEPTQEAAAPIVHVEEDQQPSIAARYESVAEYFRAGNPDATTYRLGEPLIERKSFSTKQRKIIHRENGGVCQVCGSAGPLEVEHRRALMNGGGNERENLGSLCVPHHVDKTAMDTSLRRQREKLLKQ